MSGAQQQDRGEAILAELYRTATPAKKLTAVNQLNRCLIALKEAYLVSVYPSWTTEQRRAELRRWWFSARDMELIDESWANFQRDFPSSPRLVGP